MPVKDASGKIVGMMTTSNLTTFLVKKKLSLDDKLEGAMIKEFRRVSSTISLSELARIFTRHSFVFIDDKSISSNIDLLSFMVDHP